VAACRVSRIAELQQQKLGRTKFETPLVETVLRMAAVQEEGRKKAGRRQVDRRASGQAGKRASGRRGTECRDA
jgi:hypothetical protein